MVLSLIRATRIPAEAFRAASLGSIVLCLSLWIRAKTIDQAERGNAERRAIFVGLWPPMLWLIGEVMDDER